MSSKKEKPPVAIASADLDAVSLANAALKAATDERKGCEGELLAATQGIAKLDVVMNITRRLNLAHVVEEFACKQVLQSAAVQEHAAPYHTYAVFESGQTVDLSGSSHELLLRITALYNGALDIMEGTPIDVRVTKANATHQCFEFLSRFPARGIAVGICHLVVEEEGRISIAHAWELLPTSQNSGVMRVHDKHICGCVKRDLATDRVLKNALAGEVFRKQLSFHSAT